MPVRHDQIHKELIRTFPAEFVRLIAPRLARGLDLEQLAFRPEEHFIDNQERRLDLVARVPQRRSPAARVVLHVEVELEHRATMAPRLFNYNRGLSRADPFRVHSAVLFLRGGPGGVRRGVYREGSLGLPICAFHYHSLGLSRASAQGLLRRRDPLCWALAALVRLGSAKRQAEHCLACLSRIARSRRLNDRQRFLLSDYVKTYVESDVAVARELSRLLQRDVHRKEVREVSTMITTWSERIESQGIQKGLEKGLQEGRREGLDEGLQEGRQQERARTLGKLRDRLSRLLGERFGALPASVSERLSRITSPDELMDLLERAFAARSLDELGLASRP